MSKERTRLARSLFRKLGYGLYRLQRTNISTFEDGAGRGLGGGFDAFEVTLERPVQNFDIVMRVCSRAEMDNPERRRFFDAPKKEMVRACLASLVASVNDAVGQCPETEITLTIVDNHSDADAVAVLKAELDQAQCRTEIVNPAPEFIDNGPSMRASYTYGRDNGRDVLYFVEDDYLHDLPAIAEIIGSFGRIAGIYGHDVVLFPMDNPDSYRNVTPTHLVLGRTRHWRRTWATTWTCVTTAGILRKYWQNYDALGNYGADPTISEHNTVNLIYKEVPCLSPIPSLSLHMQMLEHISPYVDWRAWWARHSDVPLKPLNLT